MTTSERSPLNVSGQMELNVTSSAEGSPAKMFREPATVLGSMAKDRGSGLNFPVSLARFDRPSRSWKTWQRSLTTEWGEFLETWPASGMTRNGQLYPLAPLVRHTCDSECSLWPTPTASMDGRGFGIPLHKGTGRYKQSTVSRVHDLVFEHGWRIHPNFTEALMGFPSGWTEIEPSEMLSRQASQS